MSDPKGRAAVTPSDLAVHGAFVRALAASLVSDPNLADDVAQETWASALEKAPPARAAMRSWLAAVARNAARKIFRGDSRRARREALAARAERLPSAADAAALASALRGVVEAVLALDEPYRSTVLFRYYEDLSVKEIAERAGAPVATVESRLRRALERLRERLDRESGGDRDAWRASLGALAGLPRVAPLPFAWPLAIGSVAAAGAAMVAWAALDGGAPERPRPAPLAATAPSSGANAAARGSAPSAPAIEPTGIDATPPGGEGSSDESAALSSPLLEGLVVDPAGAPVAGATIWARVLFEIVPIAESDAEGRFRIPRPADAYSLHARAAGFAPSLAREIEDYDGSPTGPILFRLPGPGATVTGLVTDASGSAIPFADVRVGAVETVVLSDPFDRGSRAPAIVVGTDADGRFRAEDVELGTLTAEASAPGYAPTEGYVATAAGETASLELRLDRGAILAGVLRDESGAPIPNGHVCLVSPDPGTRLVRCATGEDGSFRLDRMEPGSLAFHAADAAGERHANMTIEIGRGGEATWNPVLAFSDGISGRVVDEDGRPLSGLFVYYTVPDRLDVWHGFTKTGDDGAFFIGCSPQIEGQLAVFEVDLGFFQFAPPLAVDLEARPGDDDVTLRVAHSRGPRSFVEGTLLSPGGEPMSDMRLILRSGDRTDFQVGSLEPVTGRFRIGPLRPGTYRLTVATRLFGQHRVGDFEVAPGESLDLGTVRLDPPGALETTVRWVGSPPRGSLEFRFDSAPERDLAMTTPDSFPSPLPLAAGSYRLAVRGSHVRPAEFPIEIRSGEATALEIPLVPATRRRLRFVTEEDAAPLGSVRVVVRRFGESIVLYDHTFVFDAGAEPVAEIDVDPALFELEATSETGLRGTLHGNWLSPSPDGAVLPVQMKR